MSKGELLLQFLAEDGVSVRGGGKQRTALCPFHEDKTPSFSIETEKGLYFCHACGAKGDAVDYLVAARNIDKKEALERVNGKEPAKERRSRWYSELPRSAVALHRYLAVDGEEVFTVARFDGQPKVLPFSPSWRGDRKGWINSISIKKNRPLYRLPEFLKAAPEAQVWIVEGEKCADAVARAFPVAVTTWSGGTKSDHLSDWRPLAGRPVVLLADRDDHGREAMRRIAARLHALGAAAVKGCLPEGEDGTDIADLLAAHPREAVFELVRQTIAPIDPAPDEVLLDDAEADGPPLPEVLTSDYFSVLGTAHPGKVVIKVASNELLVFGRAILTQASTLVAIAPQAWWLQAGQSQTMTRDLCMSIGDILIREAERLGRVDLGRIVGRGAHRDEDDRVVWHLGDRLLVDGQEEALRDTEHTIYTEGARVALAPAEECASEGDREAFAEAVMAYRWATPDDGRRFVGWLVSALAGGALEWRPHTWLVAPAAAGKSWLLQRVVMRLMGSLCPRLADVTPAGIARRVGSESVPVIIEEGEPDKAWIEELVSVVRLAAGGDGERVRAAADHGVSIDNPRFSVLIASTKLVRLREADASRFVMLELARDPVADWPAVRRGIEEALKGRRAERLRSAIIRATPEIAEMASGAAEKFAADGVPTREAMVRGALTAGWNWMSGGDEEVLRASPRPDQGYDAQDALREIVSLRVRKAGGEEESIADMILTLTPTDTDTRRARSFGIQYDPDEGLAVAINHPALEVQLRRTRLARVELSELLKQIEGAHLTTQPRRFGAIRCRAVIIPPEACEAANLHIDTSVQVSDSTEFA